MSEKIVKLVIEAIEDIIPQQGLSVPADLDSNTRLFGEDGILDSMGLVTLVIAVEEAILEAFDQPVSLADEKAMSQASSPYRTVSTLADYAQSQMEQ